MTLKNHREMGNRIYSKLRDQGVFLSRFWFILGNLAPDLYFSFIFRRHEYAPSAGSVKKLMRRLYEGRVNPRSALFSYSLGIANHYVCDYFCYPHSPAFKGSIRDHISYEVNQKPRPEDSSGSLSFEDTRMDFQEMVDKLDEYLARHNRSLNRGIYDDIAPAVNAAVHLNAVMYIAAEESAADFLPAALMPGESVS
ncbi:MAG: zinc dependent phospholipase C family protein [Treponema sp.]|jgi:hypothetical protein|nr:zinc dependent phospholipase C family protein [Treponema sp.]